MAWIEAPRWIKCSDEMPPVGDPVKVYQLFSFEAVWNGEYWNTVDGLGNKRRVMWKPEYWGREIHVYLPAQPEGKQGGRKQQ